MSGTALAVPGLAESYRERGFAVARGVLGDAALSPFIGRIDLAVDALARELHARGECDGLHADLPFDRRLARLLRGREFGRGWDEPVFGPELHALITQPGIIELLRPLLGDAIWYDGDYHLRPKLPGSELTSFPWHQDSQYYGPGTEAIHIVTVWIPLIDVDEDNGCLWVIPGSHRWGLLDGQRGADMNMRTAVDVEARGRPEPVPMRRGDVLLFSNLTFHASRLNRTEQVRWSLDLRYSPDPAGRLLPPAEARARELRDAKLRHHMPGFRAAGAAGPEPFAAWAARRHLTQEKP